MMFTKVCTGPLGPLPGRQFLKAGLQGQVHRALALDGAADQVRQAAAGLGAEDQVEVRRRGQEALALLLGHAAAHPDDEVGPPGLQELQAPEQTLNLLFGLAPDGAGVDEIKVRLFGPAGELVLRRQQLGHPLGVGHVHLTAEGANIELLFWHRHTSYLLRNAMPCQLHPPRPLDSRGRVE